MIRFETICCRHAGAAEPVLRGVDLRVAPGRCVLLQGGSGGGKSTLVRLVCGVITGAPNAFIPAEVSGRVLVNGRDVAGRPLHETGRSLATVFQDCRSQFFMTHVGEELVFAAENYGKPRAETGARLRRFAALMDVERLMERSVFRLSSGQRQRVAIAAAAIQGPLALVLDEPSANLDAQGLARLAELLAALKAEGCAVLVADHRAGYLDGVADERLRLEAGRLLPPETARDLPWNSAADLAAASALDSTLAPATGFGALSEYVGGQAPAQPPAHAVDQPSARRGDLPKTHADGQPAAQPPLLELCKAGLTRGGRTILQEANLSLRGGELLALCGGNGAGKTSLLRALCGLEGLACGQVLLRGRQAGRQGLRGACALVMQDPDYQLFAGSVAEELGLGLQDEHAGPQAGERAAALAGRMGLAGLLDRHPGSLSMGEKQRTLIAAALAAGRDILLLDEPTSGMDAGRMAELARELRQWTSSGRAVLVVTHDEAFLDALGGRRLTLHDGRLTPAPNTKES